MVANTKKKLQENKVINFYSNGETIILNKKNVRQNSFTSTLEDDAL